MIKKNNFISSKKGFTLTEVIISLVILGLISTFLTTAIPQSFIVGQEVQDISKASDLAQRYVENIKSELSKTAIYDNAIAGSNPPIQITDDFTNSGYFSVQTTVTDLEIDLIQGNTITVLKQIDVEYLKTANSMSLFHISTLMARAR